MTDNKFAALIQDKEYNKEDLRPMGLYDAYDTAVGAMVIRMQEELHAEFPDAQISATCLVDCGFRDGVQMGIKIEMKAYEQYKLLAEKVGYVFDMGKRMEELQ